MGGPSPLLLLLFSSISFSNGLDCLHLQEGTTKTCSGDTVCKVTIVGRTIVKTDPCAAPMKANCEMKVAESAAPTSLRTLVVDCQCKETGCDKTIDTFKKELDQMKAQSKPVLGDKCKTVSDMGVLVYSILFGLVLAFIPAIIFFLVRLFLSKRKMDSLESKVTSSLRQLQQDMVGNSKNVHDVRKKMEQLTSDAIHSGGSKEQTVTGAEGRTSGGTTMGRGSEKGETIEDKKDEKKEDPNVVEPNVKSVTLGPPHDISCNDSIVHKYRCPQSAACVYSILGETLLPTAVFCTEKSFDDPDCHSTVLSQRDRNHLIIQCLCSTNECSQKVWKSAKKKASEHQSNECISSSRLIMHILVVSSVSFITIAVLILSVFQLIDIKGFDRQSKEIESRLAEIKWEIANAQIIDAPIEQKASVAEEKPLLHEETTPDLPLDIDRR
ncbi:hypothetical protein PRIPAC_74515 [Pristionchus pacificus]|uniref:Uncharacterized protein n=1 Tax=Pristionchus pacificus TaxID=54126 RepID=A0A2A6CZX7_PRIPA|nr:hypothetical protein PRIPAC_74515 [Pristionchus pacificus]|eukprot:PDM83670.1 hypothetical protein PRIPAC_30157 [Pristionchus pacificus]